MRFWKPANSARDDGKRDRWNDHVASESSVSFTEFSTSTIDQLTGFGMRE